MRFRSQEREKEYRVRRRLVRELLDDAICERCQAARATEVHEVLSRARGGSILDRANCRALCHDCHRWVTEHPADAVASGWLAHSWGPA